jgi:hypothetical protein
MPVYLKGLQVSAVQLPPEQSDDLDAFHEFVNANSLAYESERRASLLLPATEIMQQQVALPGDWIVRFPYTRVFMVFPPGLFCQLFNVKE